MPDTHVVQPKPDRRAARPERIDIGSDILVRNDVIAREQGTTERTLNRDDAKGAPYTYCGGIKYRPLAAYRKFLASKIRVQGQGRKTRRRGGA